MATYVYVLELEGGHYYVGKTMDLKSRLAQHMNGIGSAWTTLHRPVGTTFLETRPMTSDFDEDIVTKEYMRRYGIDKVRGAGYTFMEIPADMVRTLQHELRGSEDRCYRCLRVGHFARGCSETTRATGEPIAPAGAKGAARPMPLSSCGAAPVAVSASPATAPVVVVVCPPPPAPTNPRKRASPDSGAGSGEESSRTTPSSFCNRCRRAGHSVHECYAKTRSDGTLLQPRQQKEEARPHAPAPVPAPAAEPSTLSSLLFSAATAAVRTAAAMGTALLISALTPAPTSRKKTAARAASDSSDEEDEEEEEVTRKTTTTKRPTPRSLGAAPAKLCTRCGRTNHMAGSCYAKKNAAGEAL
jgi:predicted GIY-YIG superfamily endonuclease